MAEKKLSLFFRVEDGVIGHNNRDFTAENVDPSRSHLNITYKQESIEDKYRELFSDALKKYNDRQTRSDRMIENYLEHIKKSKQEKPFYEIVVQIGKREECGIGTDSYDTAVEMLDIYMQDFEKRNPNMVVINACMHLDESTPHLHIDFIPVCHNQKRGLETRTSLKQALAEQGVFSQSIKFTERAIWAQREKQRLEEILHEHDIDRKIVGANYSHKSVKEFKAYQQQLDELNEKIDTLTQKPTEQISASEAGLLKNKTLLLQRQLELKDEQINLKDEEISTLREKSREEYAEFPVHSNDKLFYVMDELRKQNVPVIEESNSLYIPKYAVALANEIARNYHPNDWGVRNIRDRVRLDIDRLIYKSDSFDELLDKLRERGYEVKLGKYISAKPPFGKRAVRIENLGKEYSREQLEKRIAERMDAFETAIEKSHNSYETEQPFYDAQVRIMCEVAEYRIYPAKKCVAFPYSFVNDENIAYLSRQIQTMNDYNIHSANQMYDRASALEDKIEMFGRVAPLTKEREELARLSELIKTYEYVVKGNFIDNLVQKERERLAAEERRNNKQNAQSSAATPINQDKKIAPPAPDKAQENTQTVNRKPKKHGR